jgi:excisionase family DNA binding protein
MPMTVAESTPKPGMTVAEAARSLRVSAGTIYRWIGAGTLRRLLVDGRTIIPYDGNSDFFREHLLQRASEPERAYVAPEISRYSKWHEVLDEFVWLLKACYSEPRDLKRRRFRTDVLFSHYVRDNSITLGKLRSAFLSSSTTVPSDIWEDLQRGWYNELAFNLPLRASTLGLSFADLTENEAATAARFTFPSWRITTAYYSVYFYLRAVTRLKQPKFRLVEHGATLRNFKNCALHPFESTVWRFPFDIAYLPGTRKSRKEMLPFRLKHLRFKYALHPRPPHRSPAQAFEHIRQVFRKRSRLNNQVIHYTLFDFLHDFRVWANYLEIEHLLNLRGPGYKGFLDQALSSILFFVGGVTELVFLALVGETCFRNKCQRFYSVICAASSELESAYPLLPLSQRLDLMKAHGFVLSALRHKVKSNKNLVLTSYDGGA